VPYERRADHAGRIVALLEELRARSAGIADATFRQRIQDAVAYGVAEPLALDFGTSHAKGLSPNAVGFQFVLTSIATRLKATKRQALSIVVDRQQQFNGAQLHTFDFYTRLSQALQAIPVDKQRYLRHPYLEGAPDDMTALVESFPAEKLRIATSANSIGLQLVDVYLWLVDRMQRGDELSVPLRVFAGEFARRMRIDGISLEGMRHRWRTFEAKLPPFETLTPEQLDEGRAVQARHDARLRELGVRS
jgi:hypothetical protein